MPGVRGAACLLQGGAGRHLPDLRQEGDGAFRLRRRPLRVRRVPSRGRGRAHHGRMPRDRLEESHPHRAEDHERQVDLPERARAPHPHRGFAHGRLQKRRRRHRLGEGACRAAEALTSRARRHLRVLGHMRRRDKRRAVVVDRFRVDAHDTRPLGANAALDLAYLGEARRFGRPALLQAHGIHGDSRGRRLRQGDARCGNGGA